MSTGPESSAGMHPDDEVGFIAVPAWVVANRHISNEGKLVYLLLAARSNVTVQRDNAPAIAEYIGVTLDMFNRALANLRANGAVEFVNTDEHPHTLFLSGTSVEIAE